MAQPKIGTQKRTPHAAAVQRKRLLQREMTLLFTLFGEDCEGHAHVDDVSNDAEYVLAVWTPGNFNHTAHWYVNDRGRVVERTGQPTAQERALLRDLLAELRERYALE